MVQNMAKRPGLFTLVRDRQEEYNDQKDDIRGELEKKYGNLTACELPRPSPRGPAHDPPGIGLAFVAFEVS